MGTWLIIFTGGNCHQPQIEEIGPIPYSPFPIPHSPFPIPHSLISRRC
ncbi:MAG: hypothetical protein F6K31_22630 [Symploca sp. SIO2G7]|nr:hypothetical protein [Symploca sp. SIO2G7]